MLDNTLADVLIRLGAGEITLDEANALLFITPLDPGLTCATCVNLHGATCERPGQPVEGRHPQSVRCNKYDRRDERADSLPVTPKRNGSMMFK